MPENKFLRIVVLLLLLLNAGTLGFVLLHQLPGSNGDAGRSPRDGGGPARFLRSELALTDAQEEQYRKLRNHHHDQVEELHKQIRGQQQRLYALMSHSDTTGIARQSAPIVDSIAAGQRRIVSITFDHFRDVRSICSPAQQRKFDEVILEALSQLH